METNNWLNRNVLWMSYASMLCDMGTEILKALLPALIISAGGTAAVLAAIESGGTILLAVTPLVVGWLSDYTHERKLFVATGYFFNSLGLMIIYSSFSTATLAYAKLFTSLGKGIRQATKNALLGESVAVKDAGKAFGFNSTLDTLGALIGPFIGFELLQHIDLHAVFSVSLFLPLASSLIILYMVSEPQHYLYKKPSFSYSLTHYSAAFRSFLATFVCFNISSLLPSFLLLHAYHALELHTSFTTTAGNLLLFYALYNMMFITVAFAAGYGKDTIGSRFVLSIGYTLNTLTLIGFALMKPTHTTLVVLFMLMGLRAGLTEGVEKAHADGLLPDDLKGSGYGLLEFWQATAQIISSIIFGLVWTFGSTKLVFIVFAFISSCSVIMLQLERR